MSPKKTGFDWLDEIVKKANSKYTSELKKVLEDRKEFMDNSLEFIYFLHDTIKMMYKEINIFLGYNNAKNIITRYYHGRQKAFTLNFTLIMALGKCNEFEEAIRMIECGGHDIHSKRDRKMIIVYYLVEGIYKNANYGYKTRINTYREKKLELKEKYNIKL